MSIRPACACLLPGGCREDGGSEAGRPFSNRFGAIIASMPTIQRLPTCRINVGAAAFPRTSQQRQSGAARHRRVAAFAGRCRLSGRAAGACPGKPVAACWFLPLWRKAPAAQRGVRMPGLSGRTAGDAGRDARRSRQRGRYGRYDAPGSLPSMPNRQMLDENPIGNP